MIPAPQPHPERDVRRGVAMLEATRDGRTVKLLGWSDGQLEEITRELQRCRPLAVATRFDQGQRIKVVRRRETW